MTHALHPAPPLRPADLRLPHTERGLRIGLFGGSFNPPHEGHLLVAETALQRLRLDRVWWMVTPGNPLKDHGNLKPLAERVALSRRLVRDPRILVTALEAVHQIRYTADTVALLRRRKPDVRFVWLMGADSLAGFHRWQSWRTIARQVPLAVIDRPGATLSLLSSPAARALGRFRLAEADAPLLALSDPPAWVFLHGPRSPLSSTLLRERGTPTEPTDRAEAPS
ncbi:nicotinate-nucleotide adenylyltransferase [Aureimonas pseudogalii]|uniref:Probable nicotinate-nucleotide adenylyltransferase n=1 Tax=Aureimonas pseudogalii TaxID=1744844 RepID=A0A7W6MLK4_9HYPH|nr:nicotinate-nucleotide adenylyltransferase [Aureimonas pseudogalii]MBB3999898.1 nicotinate-nucleotide adenylyltransferase [Aureimonas pseudogalii]